MNGRGSGGRFPQHGTDTHRVNHQIRISQIRVIGVNGEQLGIMSPDEAREKAAELNLDLVEVAAQARPPVCRIMDYGKFRYDASKRASQQKAARVDLKMITLRPKTDQHDLDTKIKQARGFLTKGDRVKFVLRMRGRERSHMDMWLTKLREIVVSLEDIAQVTQWPTEDGRILTATVEPIVSKSPEKPKAEPSGRGRGYDDGPVVVNVPTREG